MTPVVRRSLESRGFHVKREFAAPWGICDLVGVDFNPVRVKQRLALGQLDSIGPPVRVELLSRIPDEATGSYAEVSRLQNEFAGLLDEAQFTEVLAAFRASGFRCLSKTRRGSTSSMAGNRSSARSLQLN